MQNQLRRSLKPKVGGNPLPLACLRLLSPLRQRARDCEDARQKVGTYFSKMNYEKCGFTSCYKFPRMKNKYQVILQETVSLWMKWVIFLDFLVVWDWWSSGNLVIKLIFLIIGRLNYFINSTDFNHIIKKWGC